MNKKADTAAVWYMDLAANALAVERVAKALRKEGLLFQSWQKNTDAPFGLILINGVGNYEALVSVLNLQLKHRNNRIVVLNVSPTRMDNAVVFKLLNYGAEYFFEGGNASADYEYIVQKFLRWRAIEIVLAAPSVRNNVVGESVAIKKLLRDVIEVSLYSDVSVLIQGERGTGKESIAHLIHELDRKRTAHNLVLVDCTTLRPELSGSEFFGHEKGAYTGAESTREGAFALANNGTLFLDEVGELPLPMQAELLRILQEGAYKKLGSNVWKQANFRLVCATNRNLAAEAERGAFRNDLFDRLSMYTCFMPPLHERREDLPLLVNHFLSKRFPDGAPPVDESVMDYFAERTYHGNVRELQNLVNRMALRYTGNGPLTVGDIPDGDREWTKRSAEHWYESTVMLDKITEALRNGYDAKNIMDTVKAMVTKAALATADNNKEVSQLLGKSERWIQLQKAKEK